ncbi:phosphoenolpyruvate--protein phosphotransferase [Novosphingobium sp. 9]|uniref:phosphoenolpyruvate--protein phosphotransferase n=1 Tax=Novosphingobium sp. 9 TaxID=2025349 RepID=UPI0021B4E607|nr:phosphoenolpyruvate--protein phosphotransferase [Novosphingobium sp. 9]
MPASTAPTTQHATDGAGGQPIRIVSPLAGWLGPLDELPDPVFAGRALGDGVAIDPTGDTLHAPCDGEIASVATTGHAVTLRLPEGAELLMHLGIDTVAMGGRGFEPLVKAGQVVRAGDPLVRFDLDAVVCSAISAMTPVLLLESESFTARDLRAAGPVAVGDAIMTLYAAGAPVAAPAVDIEGEDIDRRVTVPLRHGIHARPAARLRQTAGQFDAVVRMEKGNKAASLRSPVAMLALGVRLWDEITLHARGPQALAALDALEELIASGMGELANPGETPPALVAPVAEAAPKVAAVTTLPDDGVLRGVSAAPGIAVGRVVHHRLADIPVAESSGDVAAERAALDGALSRLAAVIAGESAHADPRAASILAAHAAMLEDEDLRLAAHEAIGQGASAGAGWKAAVGPQAEALAKSGDARLAERADDMRDLERRVLAELAGIEERAMDLPEGAVLVAEDLLPSQLMSLDTARLAGIALVHGGPTSHVAILAGGMGVPMVVAMGPVLRTLDEGSEVVVDAASAAFEARPDAARIAAVRDRLAVLAARRAAAREATAPCTTKDGTRIEVFANTGSREDAELAVANGAEGCGLLRSEFLFLDRPAAPDVEEQTASYQAIADALEGRPLIVRLLDIGGDKPASYLPITGEENPALGLRGIRVGFAYPDMLEAQVEAIARVLPVGRCKIMIPMIASLSELRAVREVLDRVSARLGLTERVELGIMVETPAAAVSADILAREADFLSIGTNDLTQYALAMDRGNAAVAASLDGLHPAVLRMIAQTCVGGAKHGRWTGVCGSLASDPVAVPLLLGLGVTELSASAALVTDIKALVGTLDLDACRALAQRALECSSAAEVRNLVAAFQGENEA